MVNIPLFTRFYTSQVVSRISEPSTVFSIHSKKNEVSGARESSGNVHGAYPLTWTSSFSKTPRNKTAMNTKDIGRKPRQRQPLWVETRKHYTVNVKTCETLVATFSRAVYIIYIYIFFFPPHVATAQSYLTRKINIYIVYIQYI